MSETDTQTTYTFNILNITKITNSSENTSIVNNNEYEESTFLQDDLELLAATSTVVPFSAESSNTFKYAKFSNISDPNFTVKTYGGDSYLRYTSAVKEAFYIATLAPIYWNSSIKYEIFVDVMNVSGIQTNPNAQIEFSLYEGQVISLLIKGSIGISGTLLLRPSS